MTKVPDKIGKYTVVGEIARGGMGAIYKAEHPTLDRFVVIKKLTLGGQASVRERFRREAAVMMDFRNEYIVDVYDHFREGSSYYIVQEFVDGLSLEGLLTRERYLPERIALLIFRDACRALKYAHDRGVVHRDIKPGNILISRRGDVKLVDFGIARVEDDDHTVLTREGMMLGTPSYMAPEQFEDTRSVDKRADIYSLGVMLYEMTTGKRPYPGSVSPETVRRIQQGKYRGPKRLNPALSSFIVGLIRKTMNANMKKRYRDLGPVLRKIDRRIASLSIEDEKSELGSYIAGTWVPSRSSRGKKRVIIPAIAAILCLIAGATALAYRAGAHFEYLRSNDFGALVVTARVPKDTRAADRIYISADLFTDDGKEVPLYEKARFVFHPDPSRETSDVAVFVSDRVYAPVGTYRLKVQADGRLYWTNFYLDSRNVQKRDPDTSEGLSVKVSADLKRSLPLSVSVHPVSASGGAPVTSDTRILVYSGGAWLPFDDDLGRTLTTGTVQKFQIAADGFFPEYYSLMVQPFQTELRIDCALVPYPAAVQFDVAIPDAKLLLDGSKYYEEWGPRPERKLLQRGADGSVSVSLSPGRHALTVKRGSNSVVVPFSVGRLERVVFSVTMDSNKKDLRVREVSRVVAPELGR